MFMPKKSIKILCFGFKKHNMILGLHLMNLEMLRYLRLNVTFNFLTENGGVALGSDDFIKINKFVRRAIQQYKIYLVQYVINNGFKDWNLILKAYATKGNKERVDFYLKLNAFRTPNYQAASEGSLKGGHIDLFQYLFKKAPKGYKWDWNKLDYSVGQSGKKNVIDSYASIRGLYGGFRGSLLDGIVRSGNQELFDYILNFVPDLTELRWDFLIDKAFLSQDKSLIDHILALTPNFRCGYDQVIIALQLGNIALFDYVRSPRHLNEGQNVDWQDYAIYALMSNKREMFDYIRSLASVNYDWSWNELIGTGLLCGSKYLFDYIRSLAPQNYEWDWHIILSGAIFSGNRKLIDYIRSITPQNYIPDWNSFSNELDLLYLFRRYLIEPLMTYAKELFTS